MVNIPSLVVPPPGVETWIEAARRGDREALGRALTSFRKYLLLLANERIEPELAAKGGASDIVQDTFFRAHRSFGDFRGGSEAEWRNWLRAILIRTLAHHRRRYDGTSKRRPALEVSIHSTVDVGRGPASNDPTPSRELARRECEVSLLAALDRLPVDYRDVVILHHRECMSFEEIGRRQGISSEAARKRWSRALGRLRQELESAHGLP
jgi:RNA polymerase sigma-70 factor (ECF subfamily)